MVKVKIRTNEVRLFIPVPIGMIGFVVKMLPEKIFEDIRENIPEPYCHFITKQYISVILSECIDIFKENKGLEILHVEADGTFISIKL